MKLQIVKKNTSINKSEDFFYSFQCPLCNFFQELSFVDSIFNSHLTSNLLSSTGKGLPYSLFNKASIWLCPSVLVLQDFYLSHYWCNILSNNINVLVNRQTQKQSDSKLFLISKHENNEKVCNNDKFENNTLVTWRPRTVKKKKKKR